MKLGGKRLLRAPKIEIKPEIHIIIAVNGLVRRRSQSHWPSSQVRKRCADPAPS